MIGGSVYAADISETKTQEDTVIRTEEPERLMGDVMPVTSCPEDTTIKTEEPERMMGDVMPVTGCSDKYCQETEITPTMGVAISSELTKPESTVTRQPKQTTSETSSTTTWFVGGTMPSSHNDPPVTDHEETTAVRGRGDIDGNGVTDLSDLIKLSMFLLRDIDLETPQLTEADITKDYLVDITDLPAMKMKIMTPESTVPVSDITTPATEPPQITPSGITTSGTTETKATSLYENVEGHFSLTQEPDKTEYKIGEPFDITGAKVTGNGGFLYKGQMLNWDMFDCKITPEYTSIKIDSSSFNNQIPGTYVITLSYNPGPCTYKTSFTVTVTE